MKLTVGFDGDDFACNAISVMLHNDTHKIIYRYNSFPPGIDMDLYVRLMLYKSKKHYNHIRNIIPIAYYARKDMRLK